MSMKALGGPYITKTTVIAGLFVLTLFALIGIRLVYGLSAVSNLNDGFTWGVWLAYDMVAGSAIGCGGYAVAILVYILNKGEYHPLVRPAVLASVFGYGLGGLSVMVDISRWWNFWHLMVPTYYNFNSVMLEVALCVMVYTTVLVIEFLPAVVEKAVEWTKTERKDLHQLTRKIEKILNKVVFIFIALGMTLPTMHQSSLGTMLVPFGNFVNPLWQTPILPFLYLMTALSMGYAVVMFEGTLVSDRFSRPSEARILGHLSRYLIGVLIVFMGVRWGDIIVQGKLHHVFASGGLSFAFLLENVLYLVPIVLLSNKERRMSAQFQFISAFCMLVGGILYRMDGYLIAYDRIGWRYFPSVPELLITFGMIALEVLGYVLIVKFLPVLHSDERAPKAALAHK